MERITAVAAIPARHAPSCPAMDIPSYETHYSMGEQIYYRTLYGWLGLRPLLILLLLPRRQPDGPLPRLVIHLVGVEVSTARTAAVDRPHTSLHFYVLGVAFVRF
jgi:hypothetical protein